MCYSNALIFWITSDMKILFNRIDNRADDMVTKGLIDELKNFITNHKNVDFTKSQFASIGLKQLLPLAENTCSSDVRDKCIEDLKSVTVSKISTSNNPEFLSRKNMQSINRNSSPRNYAIKIEFLDYLLFIN